MSSEQDAEALPEGQTSFPQGAARQRRGHSDHAELQAALWLAARAAIVNGRRRRQERQAQTAVAASAGTGRRQRG